MTDTAGKTWDLQQLHQTPKYRVLVDDGEVQQVLFRNEPYQGHDTEVFAYMGVPNSDLPVPAMVCVHGGGDCADKEWVKLWMSRGYAAIAIDCGGCGPDRTPLPNAGPPQDEAQKLDMSIPPADRWVYHAVAAVIRANSLIQSLPQVDSQRVGIHGISWGGFLTSIVAGLDKRFSHSISVYGCRFDPDNCSDTMMERFAEMSEEHRRIWLETYDPLNFLPNAALPMLFVNGTNDSHFPLDVMQSCCDVCPAPITRCFIPQLAHGHTIGRDVEEARLFADYIAFGSEALPSIGSLTITGRTVEASLSIETEILRCVLVYTTDPGRLQDCGWDELELDVCEGKVSTTIPNLTTACYLSVEDARGALASSQLIVLEDNPASV